LGRFQLFISICSGFRSLFVDHAKAFIVLTSKKSCCQLCHNPTLREVWGRHSHSRKWELESSGTPKNSEDDCRGQNTSHWSVLYTIEKFLKCRCSKWPRTSHLDICSSSYGQKKDRESNWQFDFRPLKVGNWPESDVSKRSVTWRWKAIEEGYKFGLDLVPIRGWGEKLWSPKVPGVQTRIVSGLHFGSPGEKCHSDVASASERREYYMGEGGGFPQVRAVVSQVSLRLPMACPNTKRMQNEF
jgi:hypothetical protein